MYSKMPTEVFFQALDDQLIETKGIQKSINFSIKNNNYVDSREGTLFSFITYTTDRFTCYAKKICIILTNSMFYIGL